MNKKIPVYFDSVVVSSPFQEISDTNPNLGRLKVRVFTKYGNRNGSYITEAVANQLVESATKGITPIVGFFDPETQSWASHTGPTLANAYGYVESFLGWEPFEDTDGIVRDYAVFSVILFTDYFEEAKKIFGQNQSMELNPTTIKGDWTMINDEEYFVYTSAEMLGFCVIGEHEPCFSVSSFFSKNDETYKSQYEKFSSLLFNLKTQVEEAEKTKNGGEQQMNDFENQEIIPVIEKNQVEDPQMQEGQKMDNFQTSEENSIENEPVAESEQPTEEFNAEVESEESAKQNDNAETSNEPSEFEALQQKFNELQESFNELQTNYSSAQVRITELEQLQTNTTFELTALRTKNEELQTSLSFYKDKELKYKKNTLIEKYEKIMEEEEIAAIKQAVNDFSYEELESKLAITFANRQIIENEIKKVPLLDIPQSQFAKLMENYRK